MNLLLCNDDGIDAPGLQALREAARAFGQINVVAPAGHQSGMSHALTYAQPVRIESRSATEHAIHGTPADCARLGLHHLAADVDWVLSGINQGGNLGCDIYYSGTVAAVREAALHGKPGIAFSCYQRESLELDWARATRWTARVLGGLMSRPLVPGEFINVNFPHLDPDAPEPEIVECPMDPNPLPLSYRADADGWHQYTTRYASRPTRPGHDTALCFGGKITFTVLRVSC